MRWPLRYQILVPFAGVLVGAVVGVSLLNAYLAARQTEQQIDGQLREVAHTLSDSTFPLTDAVLKQMRGLSGAEFILVDGDGEILASSLASPAQPPDDRPAQRWEDFHLDSSIALGAERYFHASLQLQAKVPDSQPVVLHFLYPEGIWRAARWQAAYPPLLVGAAALAVGSLLALGIAARLSRPIVQLRSQVERLAQGDFRPLSLPSRNDEVGDLVGSVNSLAGQLDELRRAIKRSERLALIGQLSGGLAHHLRNDVTGARMAVQLHQRHCDQTDPESLEVALRQLTLAEGHLQQFLAAGHPQPLRRSGCDLANVVGELSKLVEPGCRHRRVELRIEPPAMLSPGDAFPVFRADPEQLRQLLLNLVLNAIEAAGAGGRVSIEWMVSGPREIRLQVRDSGPGPPPELLERLFEPFATAKPEGIGLGLAVARQIAEAHGGTLRYLRDAETCFELTLPLDLVDTGVELALRDSSPAPNGSAAAAAQSSKNAALET